MTFSTPYASVRPAGEAEHGTVVSVLVEAFTHDPLVRWLFPEAAERGRLQSLFHGSQLAHPAAEAYLAGDGDGAAVWLALAAGQAPHDERPVPAAAGEEPSFGASGSRLRALGDALATRHPIVKSHLYLPSMGVVEGRQGAGLGSAMLRHRLDRADADGIGAYLEASSPRSRALYQRYGFEDLGAPVRVADSPPLWPMWRPPGR
ncbi:GNAT family N-acetyltransferase [Jiangella gansuensis]|uniref:GNAT family N-acetyltransferase n=1 Tax=Jiangella gansuensis TaxID=281473 RepID=UPI0006880FC0|nr:GNAT family N-acetyltransferase [Jiangella gansuensis]